jgi:hypothetical protein
MLRKYRISEDDFDILEEVVQLQQPYKAGKPWKFAGSFYYATTVLTTIGKLTSFLLLSVFKFRGHFRLLFRSRPL